MRQVHFHDAEGAIAVFHPVLERVLLQIAPALDQRQPEIGGADIGLQAVLLEEHPLHGFGPFDAVFRRQHRAAGDVPQDGVGFGEMAAGRDFQQRYLAAGILLEEFRRAGVALKDVDLDQLERNTELGEREPDLVAIARTVVE